MITPSGHREAIFNAWQRVAPGRPYVTVLTDIADFPPHFWMERPQLEANAQYFICGSPHAVEQACAALGAAAVDAEEEFARFGLDRGHEITA